MQAYPENYTNPSKLFETSPYWEKLNKKERKDITSTLLKPYVIKTHFKRWELSDRPEGLIYIARNPLDTALSFFFHDGQELCDDPDYKLWHLKLKCADIAWFDHVKNWHEFTDDGKLPLFLTYEEMHKNYSGVLSALCEFLGLDRNKIDFEKVKFDSSFSEMKKIEASLNSPTSGAPLRNFCRKGIIGDWKNHLRSDMVEMIYEQYYTNGIDRYYGPLDDWAVGQPMTKIP